MTRRFLLLLAAALSAAAQAGVVDTIRSTGDTCSIVLDSSGAQIGKTCKSVGIFRSADVFPAISYGVGIPAVSVNLKSGAIGYLSSVDPVVLNWNTFQHIWIRSSEVHRLALWSASIGLSCSKTDSGGLTLGVTVVPWGLRVDSYTFGLGVRWTATDAVSLSRRSFAAVLPLTFSL